MQRLPRLPDPPHNPRLPQRDPEGLTDADEAFCAVALGLLFVFALILVGLGFLSALEKWLL